MKKINIPNQIQFECQGSANCCVSRGEYGFVYLSKADIKRLSEFMGLKTLNFIKLYCDKTEELIHLKEINTNGDCQFLLNKKCSVYAGRPIQCRTWPFWEENMNAKTWSNVISKNCPGVGKGKIFKKKEIIKLIEEDNKNEKKIISEAF